jgi:hypothetical protein
MELTRKLENSKKLADVYKERSKKSAVCTSQLPHPIDVQLELDEAIVKAVSELIASDRRFSRYGNARKGRLIAKAVFHSKALGSISLPFIIAHAKKWLWKHVITPWKMLQVMDLAGGSCNYKGVEVLQQLETGGKCFVHGSELEKKADEIVPYKEIQTKWGKGIKFCEARTLRLACNTYGITEKSKCSPMQFLNQLMLHR